MYRTHIVHPKFKVQPWDRVSSLALGSRLFPGRLRSIYTLIIESKPLVYASISTAESQSTTAGLLLSNFTKVTSATERVFETSEICGTAN